jgi:hypothetical protein
MLSVPVHDHKKLIKITIGVPKTVSIYQPSLRPHGFGYNPSTLFALAVTSASVAGGGASLTELVATDLHSGKSVALKCFPWMIEVSKITPLNLLAGPVVMIRYMQLKMCMSTVLEYGRSQPKRWGGGGESKGTLLIAPQNEGGTLANMMITKHVKR